MATAARAGPAALGRRLRLAAMWQVAALLNVFVGLVTSTALGNALFTTAMPWLLPLGMLLTKLLLLQAFRRPRPGGLEQAELHAELGAGALLAQHVHRGVGEDRARALLGAREDAARPIVPVAHVRVVQGL